MKDSAYVSAMEETMIETGALTDVGNVRNLNEDSVAVVHSDIPGKSCKGTILVLADGLGGYKAGEVASTMVTSMLPELYLAGSGKDYVSDFVNAVRFCNTIVHDASNKSEEQQGMGTTVVAAVLVDHYVVFVNVGDSRGYLLRDGAVVHRTRDHSLKDASMDVPEANKRNRFAHVLTRAIGPKPTVLIDVTAHRLSKGDVVLLCSDGLTDCIGNEEMKNIALNHSPADAARKLVAMAKEQGGEDNISVIIARVQEVAESGGREDVFGVEKYLVP